MFYSHRESRFIGPGRRVVSFWVRKFASLSLQDESPLDERTDLKWTLQWPEIHFYE